MNSDTFLRLGCFSLQFLPAYTQAALIFVVLANSWIFPWGPLTPRVNWVSLHASCWKKGMSRHRTHMDYNWTQLLYLCIPADLHPSSRLENPATGGGPTDPQTPMLTHLLHSILAPPSPFSICFNSITLHSAAKNDPESGALLLLFFRLLLHPVKHQLLAILPPMSWICFPLCHSSGLQTLSSGLFFTGHFGSTQTHFSYSS